MPLVPFESLPDQSRIWVFAADPALDARGEQMLLDAVDKFLGSWKAHGAPLTVGRRLDDGRFLLIGVDQTQEGASGCSIDGLYRSLREVEQSLGVTLLGGGRVFYRNASGAIVCSDRDAFAEAALRGNVTAETPVFDTSVTSLSEWFDHFETTAGASWHAALING